ncbi:MAG: hypothetical protein GY810_13035 [Aureispira sp.]|nr:hypothetical protein [Aureispira sp.]
MRPKIFKITAVLFSLLLLYIVLLNLGTVPSSSFVAYIIFVGIFSGLNFLIRRQQEKRLKRYLSHLENTLNQNATICNEQFLRIDALITIGHQKDALYEAKVNYLHKRLKAHQKNPKHYPLAVEQWLSSFEFAHPQNHSIDD